MVHETIRSIERRINNGNGSLITDFQKTVITQYLKMTKAYIKNVKSKEKIKEINKDLNRLEFAIVKEINLRRWEQEK